MVAKYLDHVSRVAVCSRSFSRNDELKTTISKRYANVTFNDDGLFLEGETLIEFLAGHDKAIVGLERINESILDSLPKLKVISKYGVGLDTIDLKALHSRNIGLGWKGGVNKRSVTELTIAFMIMLLRFLPQANSSVKLGGWKQIMGYSLKGKTIGIIGCGHVGKDLVKLLQPFKCKIIVHDKVNYEDFYKKFNMEAVDLDTLLQKSDIVTLHVPLDESTKGILDSKKLSLMKPGSCLVNTARGELVDEIKLKQMLETNILAGAAFDVFAKEPPDDMDLLEMPNFFATPHLGGSAKEAIYAMGISAIEGLENYVVPQME